MKVVVPWRATAGAPDLPSSLEPLWPAIGRLKQAAFVAVLVSLTFLAYVNSFQTGFPLDNAYIILGDSRLHEVNRANLEAIFTENYWYQKAQSGLYRPVTTLSFLLNYAVLGNKDRPAGYHWVNFVLHAANAVLAYILALVVWRRAWPAFFTAAIFAVHPVAVESVTNIVGRADLLAGLALLAGTLLYIRSMRASGPGRLLCLAAIGLVALLGVFSKENAVMLAGILVLFDLTYRLGEGNRLRERIIRFRGFFWNGYVALVPALVLLWVVRLRLTDRWPVPEFPFVDNPLQGAGFWTSRLTAIQVLGRYLALLVWPRELTSDRSYDQIALFSWRLASWQDWATLLALALVILLAVVIGRSPRTAPEVFFFALFFAVTLLPSSNLVILIGSVMAERFLYLPSLGFAGCGVWVVYWLSRKVTLPQGQILAASLLSLAVFCLGIRTWLRNSDWIDDERLWTSAQRASPNSFKVYQQLGLLHFQKGLNLANINQAIRNSEESVAILARLPLEWQSSLPYGHLGAFYRMKGDLLATLAPAGSPSAAQESRNWYRRAVDVLERGREVDRAFAESRRRRELSRGRRMDDSPAAGNTDIYTHLGLGRLRLGEVEKAAEAFAYLQQLAPVSSNTYEQLAELFLKTGSKREAIVALHQALALQGPARVVERLVSLYGEIEPANCAAVRSGGRVAVNASCPIVHQHLCDAYRRLVNVWTEKKLFLMAQQGRRMATHEFSCPAAAFP